MQKIHKEIIYDKRFKRKMMHVKINEIIEWTLDENLFSQNDIFTINIEFKGNHFLLDFPKIKSYQFKKNGIYFISIKNSNIRQTIIVKPNRKNKKLVKLNSKSLDNKIEEKVKYSKIKDFKKWKSENLDNRFHIRSTFLKTPQEGKKFKNFSDLIKYVNENIEVKFN